MLESVVTEQVLVFSVEGLSIALPLTGVVRVLRAVEVLPLPQAPAIVCGIVNVHGELIPVIDFRKCLGFPGKALSPSDQLLIVRSSKRLLALVIEASYGVTECLPGTFVPICDMVPCKNHVAGILKSKSGLILVHDLEALLSFDEDRILTESMIDA